MPVLPAVGIHPGERLQQGRLAVISVPGHREDPHASHERDHTCRTPRIGVSLEGSIRAFTSALHNGQPTGYATCASLNPPITEGVSVMAVVARVPRSRGGVSGALLILIGAWGGLAPFVGPYFRFAYTPDKAWAYTSGRLWLSIVPGAAALLGGLLWRVHRRSGRCLVHCRRPGHRLGGEERLDQPGSPADRLPRVALVGDEGVPRAVRLLHRHRRPDPVLRRAGTGPVLRGGRQGRGAGRADPVGGADGGLPVRLRPGSGAGSKSRRHRLPDHDRPVPESGRHPVPAGTADGMVRAQPDDIVRAVPDDIVRAVPDAIVRAVPDNIVRPAPDDIVRPV